MICHEGAIVSSACVIGAVHHSQPAQKSCFAVTRSFRTSFTVAHCLAQAPSWQLQRAPWATVSTGSRPLHSATCNVGCFDRF